MFSFEQSMRLARLQQRVWRALEEALREDGHRKSSDGAIEVTFSMPAAFNHDQPTWVLTLHSYVLCERGRYETFTAPTLEGVLSQAETYADKICMSYEFRAMDRAYRDPSDDDQPDVAFTKPEGAAF